MTRRFIVSLIKLYQYLISPLKPSCCRFNPSCSNFACIAIERYGVWFGLWLSFKRLIRCNPWNPGGYDPVP